MILVNYADSEVNKIIENGEIHLLELMIKMLSIHEIGIQVI
jgi:hypothetical protein